MGKPKILIIEDDLSSAFILQNLLEATYSNAFEILGVANTITAGLKIIYEKSPDLVFLDLYLPDKDGFELFNELSIVNFETIITSSDKSKGVEAIKIQALDYLVKPILPADLEASIKKFWAKKNNKAAVANTKVRIPTPNGLIVVEANHVVYCEAVGNNTIIHYANRLSQQIGKPLKELEELLVPNHFFRIQKSYLVNLQLVVEFSKADGGYVVMKYYEDRKVPLSKNLREQFLQIF
ncbi:MAG: LytTR family DNA-binding domain-containing protein [Cytophagales bacterium]|nr:LytTR family DNA-binding domain-containing protein [Cytophagales bacterium]